MVSQSLNLNPVLLITQRHLNIVHMKKTLNYLSTSGVLRIERSHMTLHGQSQLLLANTNVVHESVICV